MTPALRRAGLPALLLLLGAGWGLTQPLAKIAVSDGYRHFGLIFWQVAIGAAILGAINAARGRGLPVTRRALGLYAVVALTGTVLPNAAGYEAARHLPAGILSITIAAVPVFAYPIAMALRLDRFAALRLAGVLAGLAGVWLLVGPDTSLPDPAMAAFVPLALLAPLFYAVEGNIVAWRGLGGLDPVQVLLGASLLAAVLVAPLALATGQFIDPRPPWGAPDLALALSSVVHALTYAAYVWMVGRAGPTYAALVSYFVTGFGILWSMAILGETYSGYVWTALGLMLVALFLVQPRAETRVALPADAAKDAPQT